MGSGGRTYKSLSFKGFDVSLDGTAREFIHLFVVYIQNNFFLKFRFQYVYIVAGKLHFMGTLLDPSASRTSSPRLPLKRRFRNPFSFRSSCTTTQSGVATKGTSAGFPRSLRSGRRPTPPFAVGLGRPGTSGPKTPRPKRPESRRRGESKTKRAKM